MIARKAIARSVSDIAAMCGHPLATVCTACFAGEDAKLAKTIFDSMAAIGEVWGAPLVGGDFASGNCTQFTTTVVGSVARANPGPILRSGAKIGDGLWVTGAIGQSYKSGHHLRFTPRVTAGLELRRRLATKLHAAIDVSDGLGRDSGRIARASQVRIELDAQCVPLRDARRSVEQAIADGEDYELLFAASPDAKLPETLDDGTPVTRIGTIVEGDGVILRLDDGHTIDASNAGWDHGS
jgi:thiamine-monophosphate kinase